MTVANANSPLIEKLDSRREPFVSKFEGREAAIILTTCRLCIKQLISFVGLVDGWVKSDRHRYHDPQRKHSPCPFLLKVQEPTSVTCRRRRSLDTSKVTSPVSSNPNRLFFQSSDFCAPSPCVRSRMASTTSFATGSTTSSAPNFVARSRRPADIQRNDPHPWGKVKALTEDNHDNLSIHVFDTVWAGTNMYLACARPTPP